MTNAVAEFVPVEHLPYASELTTRLPYTESALRERIAQAVGAASTCWENLYGAGVFDSERAGTVCAELTADVLRLTKLGEPSLGCATTGELLDELRTRVELSHPGLTYRTADSEVTDP